MDKMLFLKKSILCIGTVSAISLNAVIIIPENQACPIAEKFIEPKREEDSNGLIPFGIPQEMIDKADDVDEITIPENEFLVLIGITNKLLLENRGKEKITEKKIITLIQNLKYTGYVKESYPPQYDIEVNGELTTFSSNLTKVIYDYQRWRQMLVKGWIRCSGKENEQAYYRPRFVNSANDTIQLMYHTAYGPRFREILCPGDKAEGDLFEHYDFDADPESKNEPMKSIIAKFKKINEHDNTEATNSPKRQKTSDN